MRDKAKLLYTVNNTLNPFQLPAEEFLFPVNRSADTSMDVAKATSTSLSPRIRILHEKWTYHYFRRSELIQNYFFFPGSLF